MNHAVQWTRPDCTTVQSLLARHQNNYTVSHWKAAKRMLMYLRNTKHKCLRFSANKPSNSHLVGYVDSDWAGDIERGILRAVAPAPAWP